MKKIVIIKSLEKEDELQEMEVINYRDCGFYYEFDFVDGVGSLPKERVIKIEERK